MRSHRDWLIVGGGLAGCVLAWTAQRAGYRITMVEPNGADSATRVAAGILNPVTGKRLVKSWQAEVLLPAARKAYRAMEADTGRRFYRDMEIQRFFKDAGERERWLKRQADPAYQPFLGKELAPGHQHSSYNDRHGSFTITGAGVLEADRFQETMLTTYRDAGTLFAESLDYASIEIMNTGIRWHGNYYDRVIFCEGWRVSRNPWFGDLPWNPAKGEILTLLLSERLPDRILNCAKWILPLEDSNTIRVGSTWSWDILDSNPTGPGRAALLKGLHSMLHLEESDVKEHRAGVRPCTQDNLPMLGCHPVHPQLVLFNGLGSKGSLYAPLLATRLIRHLTHGEPLPAEVDIARCFRSAHV